VIDKWQRLLFREIYLGDMLDDLLDVLDSIYPVLLKDEFVSAMDLSARVSLGS
jgi:hypothetical protein